MNGTTSHISQKLFWKVPDSIVYLVRKDEAQVPAHIRGKQKKKKKKAVSLKTR